jgi:hypothetical protein
VEERRTAARASTRAQLRATDPVGGNWFGRKGCWKRLPSACFTVEAAAFLPVASQDTFDRGHAWRVWVPLEEHPANGCGAHARPGGAEPFQQSSQRNDFVHGSPRRLSAEMVRSAAAVSQAIPSFCVVAPQPLREPGAVAAQAFADLRASAATEVPSDCLVASAQFIALYLEGSWRHDESEWQDRRQLKKRRNARPDAREGSAERMAPGQIVGHKVVFGPHADLRWRAHRGRYMRIVRPYVGTRTYMLPAWVFHSRLIPIAARSS